MAIAADSIIDADDYNGIRNKIIKVLSDDGADQHREGHLTSRK